MNDLFCSQKCHPESVTWPQSVRQFLCRCSGGVRRPLAGWLFGLPGDLEAGAGVGQNSTSSANPHLWTCEASECLNQRSKCCRPRKSRVISGGCWGSEHPGRREDRLRRCFLHAASYNVIITASIPGEGGEHLESELEWGEHWVVPPPAQHQLNRYT